MKIKGNLKQAQHLKDEYLAADPQETGFIFDRDSEGVINTNVPHWVIHHSPRGYGWGYGGSGPSDLALNIAETVLHDLGHQGARIACWDGFCFLEAFAMHQELKWRFIATLPRQGGSIPYQEVRAFVEEWLAQNPERSPFE